MKLGNAVLESFWTKLRTNSLGKTENTFGKEFDLPLADDIVGKQEVDELDAV